MDFQLPAEDDPRRLAIREWLAAHPSPTGRQLAEAGYVAPHWPSPWGLDADPIHQLVIDDELRELDQALRQRLEIDGLAAPIALQEVRDPRAVDEVVDERLGDLSVFPRKQGGHYGAHDDARGYIQAGQGLGRLQQPVRAEKRFGSVGHR